MDVIAKQLSVITNIKNKSARFVTPCKFNASMNIRRKILAETKSDALVLLGSIQVQSSSGQSYVPVAMKITFMPKRKQAKSGSQIELIIFKRVVQNLILNHNTPNVVTLYDAVMCNYENAIMPIPLQQLKQKLLQRGETKKLDLLRTQTLIMEDVDGINIEQFLRSYPSADVIYSILIQILYTLECFHRVGLRHNDLHFGNILVQTLPKETFVNYFTSKASFFHVDVSKAFVKIIDFERATIPGSITNPGIHLNTQNYKYDLFSFLSRLLYLPGTPTEVKTALHSCCIGKQFWNNYQNKFQLCALDKQKKACIKPEIQVNDKELASPLRILQKMPQLQKFRLQYTAGALPTENAFYLPNIN